MPLTPEDRELSKWQVEVRLIHIFDRPIRDRGFFEKGIRDNLDFGRPDRIALVFDRNITMKTPGGFRARVTNEGVDLSLPVKYKMFLLKEYFKDGRTRSIEGTFTDPKDLGVNKGLRNLQYLKRLG